jgi:hypothetical protein
LSQLAGLAAIGDRPGLLVGGALAGLMLWGLTTFLAVRFAILSASRKTPR